MVMMMMTDDSYTTIPVKRSTKEKLEGRMKRNDTWDGVIRAFTTTAPPPTKESVREETVVEELRKRDDEIERLKAEIRKLKIVPPTPKVSDKSLDSMLLEFEEWVGQEFISKTNNQWAKDNYDRIIKWWWAKNE